jgi:hypothetical protein
MTHAQVVSNIEGKKTKISSWDINPLLKKMKKEKDRISLHLNFGIICCFGKDIIWN